MPMHAIQSSFAGGEIAPTAHGRVDLARYPISLKTCRNMIPGPHGEVYNRPGTYFIDTVKYSDKATRLLTFIASNGGVFILEIGEFYIYVWQGNAARVTAVTVTTPYAAEDIWELKFTQSADTLYIVHKDFAPRVLTRVADDNWPLTNYSYADGPFMFPNTDTTKNLEMELTAGVYHLKTGGSSGYSLFDPLHVGALFKLTYAIPANRVVQNVAGPTTTANLKCGGAWRFVTSGTWTGTVTIEKSYDNGTTWIGIQTFASVNDLNVNTFSTEETGSAADPYADFFLLRANVSALSAGTCHLTLSSDAFTHVGIAQVATYVSAHEVTCTILRECLVPTTVSDWGASTQITTEWAEGSWSNYRGWPSTVAFVQDRLTFAATAAEPQTWWATRTSNYVNFGRSIALVDSDGITVNLQSRQINPIVAIRPFLNTALLMTDFSEWSVSSTSGGAITPTTVLVKLQGNRGSGSVDPIMIGNRVIFIEPRGSAVRDMEYQYFTDTFTSENISLLANHLFKGYTIVDMAYQQEPDSLLWLVRSDGTLLCCTYLREQEMIVWSRHDTNGGTDTFESVAVIPGTNADEIWFIVKRGVKRNIERMLIRKDTTDPHFVDAGFFYSGPPRSSFTDQPQFNGYTISLLADGFVLPQQNISGGTVTLSSAASKIHAGIPYNSDIELLDPEIPMRDGTFQGRRYQISRVSIRFLNTIGGKIGPNANTLTQPMVHRDNSLSASTATPVFSGFDPYTMPQDDEQVGHFMYRQSDPLPVTILGVYSIVDPGDDLMLSGIDP